MLSGSAASVSDVLSFYDSCSLIAALLVAVSGTALQGVSAWVPAGTDINDPTRRWAIQSALWCFLFCLFVLMVSGSIRMPLTALANAGNLHPLDEPIEPHLVEPNRVAALLREFRFFPVYGLPFLMLFFAIVFLLSWCAAARAHGGEAWQPQRSLTPPPRPAPPRSPRTSAFLYMNLPVDARWVTSYIGAFIAAVAIPVGLRFVRLYSELIIHKELLDLVVAARPRKQAS
jgi:hypothetical protein